jgi:hypothetical protein
VQVQTTAFGTDFRFDVEAPVKLLNISLSLFRLFYPFPAKQTAQPAERRLDLLRGLGLGVNYFVLNENI